MGSLWNASGLSLRADRVARAACSARCCGAVNGFLVTGVGLPSLAVTIGTLALYRGFAFVRARRPGGHRLPADWTGWPRARHRRHVDPASWWSRSCVLAVVFGVVLHATAVRPRRLRDRRQRRGRHFAGVEVARTKFWLFVVSGVVCGARRHLLHAAVRQRPRRQRHRPRAAGDRRRAARRRLDLRRPRAPARRDRRRAAARRPPQRAAARRRRRQRR